jgi:hypothetical protein
MHPDIKDFLDTVAAGNTEFDRLEQLADELLERFKDPPHAEMVRKWAKELHQEDGEVEIDDDAALSEGDDNGTYVAAWVWVSYAGTELDKNAEEVES